MNNIEELFKTSGGWNEGHTVFKNGFHGNGWIRKDAVVSDPTYLDQLTKLQGKQIIREFPQVDLILGPVTGGALIAVFVAKHLGKRLGIIIGKQDPIRFHEMNIPRQGEKVVIVDDVISSGADITRFIDFVKQSDANLLGVSVWMNRIDNEINGVKVLHMMETPFQLFTEKDCPLCRSNIPVEYKDIRE